MGGYLLSVCLLSGITPDFFDTGGAAMDDGWLSVCFSGTAHQIC